ncbi:MAG: LON peptidase substrate-binding domain-containing protein [Gemmatimonadota bacterium]
MFPLANVVFFPHTFLPLHIFEPRYLEMVSAVLAGDGLIAMVLAREERPAGQDPAVYRVGSIGRVVVADEMDDGRYNIVLDGLARVALDEFEAAPGEYFTARLEILGEALPDLQDPRVADEKAGLVMTARQYGEQVLNGRVPIDFLSEALPYATLVNRCASLLQASVDAKQELLAIDDVGTRAEIVSRGMAEQIRSHAVIEQFAGRRPDDPRSN